MGERRVIRRRHAARWRVERTITSAIARASSIARPARLNPKCCPNAVARKIARSVHEAARDKDCAVAKMGLRDLTSRAEEGRDAEIETDRNQRRGVIHLPFLTLRRPPATKSVAMAGMMVAARRPAPGAAIG